MARWFRRRRSSVVVAALTACASLVLLARVHVVQESGGDDRRDFRSGSVGRHHGEYGRKRLQALPDDITSHGGQDDQTIIAVKPDPIPRKPSFLVYVYDLPEKFNTNLTRCVQNGDSCFKFNDSGMGPELRSTEKMSYRNTYGHSLEVILHEKLKASYHRTTDPNEADAFYIPFYPSVACLCRTYSRIDVTKLHDDLWEFLNSALPYFNNGNTMRPHFMALGRMEREHWGNNCPLLRDEARTSSITFIGIEQEPSEKTRRYFHRDGKEMIIAPLPSYGHFNSKETAALNARQTNVFPADVRQTERDVFMLLAASSRKGHDIRSILKRRMTGTSERYSQFSAHATLKEMQAVWFHTPECHQDLHLPIVDWMRHSVFCLQPPGYSNIRKSFFDSVMSGCIPVTFRSKRSHVIYPFERTLDYRRFSINIPVDEVLSGRTNVTKVLKGVSKWKISELQSNLAEVAPKLQYSYPPLRGADHDAFAMIIEEMNRISE
ncbi:uncharacterized protein [Diadema antillarum]|uniref:uncharacterized protein n=1 Tax=Diadema antillarum TaxID=105358 RepID=UPI003A88E4B2